MDHRKILIGCYRDDMCPELVGQLPLQGGAAQCVV